MARPINRSPWSSRMTSDQYESLADIHGDKLSHTDDDFVDNNFKHLFWVKDWDDTRGYILKHLKNGHGLLDTKRMILMTFKRCLGPEGIRIISRDVTQNDATLVTLSAYDPAVSPDYDGPSDVTAKELRESETNRLNLIIKEDPDYSKYKFKYKSKIRRYMKAGWSKRIILKKVEEHVKNDRTRLAMEGHFDSYPVEWQSNIKSYLDAGHCIDDVKQKIRDDIRLKDDEEYLKERESESRESARIFEEMDKQSDKEDQHIKLAAAQQSHEVTYRSLLVGTAIGGIAGIAIILHKIASVPKGDMSKFESSGGLFMCSMVMAMIIIMTIGISIFLKGRLQKTLTLEDIASKGSAPHVNVCVLKTASQSTNDHATNAAKIKTYTIGQIEDSIKELYNLMNTPNDLPKLEHAALRLKDTIYDLSSQLDSKLNILKESHEKLIKINQSGEAMSHMNSTSAVAKSIYGDMNSMLTTSLSDAKVKIEKVTETREVARAMERYFKVWITLIESEVNTIQVEDICGMLTKFITTISEIEQSRETKRNVDRIEQDIKVNRELEDLYLPNQEKVAVS